MICLAVSNAFLLAIHGAASAAAAISIALAGAAVGAETLGGALQLFLVTGALDGAGKGGPHHAVR